jgi:hypothetical protein
MMRRTLRVYGPWIVLALVASAVALVVADWRPAVLLSIVVLSMAALGAIASREAAARRGGSLSETFGGVGAILDTAVDGVVTIDEKGAIRPSTSSGTPRRSWSGET